jgi:hypothetical protein
LRQSGSHDELVPKPIDREDVLRFLRLLFDFLRSFTTKLSTVRFEGVGFWSPDLVEELVAAHGLTRALVEETQELDFVERERLGFFALVRQWAAMFTVASPRRKLGRRARRDLSCRSRAALESPQ